MNRESYCRAVSQIRWSAEQRRRIEAILSLPADSPEFEDETEFTVIAEVSKEELRRMNEQNEKRAKRRHFKLWILIAAAVLAAGGGVAAGVAMMQKNRNIQENSIDGELDTGLNLHLTDQYYNQAEHIMTYRYPRATGWGELSTLPCVVSEYGWYHYNTERYNIREVTEDGDTYTAYDEKSYLAFTDRESGQTVPLCARPNCEHDGSLYCTASTKAYNASLPVSYNGRLIASAIKNTDPDNYENNKTSVVLIEYEPDGTAIHELCTISDKESYFVSEPYIHRGYAWMIVNVINSKETDPLTGRITENGGWEIRGYELATGNVVCAYSVMAKPDEGFYYYNPVKLVPDGDYLYFFNTEKSWEGSGGNGRRPDLPVGLHRLNLYSGQTEHVFDGFIKERVREVNSSYTVSGNYVIGIEGGGILKVYNMETKEDIMLENGASAFLTDGEYIYMSRSDWQKNISEMNIYDFSGKLIQNIPTGKVYSSAQDILIANGSMYILQNGEITFEKTKDGDTRLTHSVPQVLYSDLASVKAGNPDWKLAYEFRSMEENYPVPDELKSDQTENTKENAKEEENTEGSDESDAQ